MSAQPVTRDDYRWRPEHGIIFRRTRTWDPEMGIIFAGDPVPKTMLSPNSSPPLTRPTVLSPGSLSRLSLSKLPTHPIPPCNTTTGKRYAATSAGLLAKTLPKRKPLTPLAGPKPVSARSARRSKISVLEDTGFNTVQSDESPVTPLTTLTRERQMDSPKDQLEKTSAALQSFDASGRLQSVQPAATTTFAQTGDEIYHAEGEASSPVDGRTLPKSDPLPTRAPQDLLEEDLTSSAESIALMKLEIRAFHRTVQRRKSAHEAARAEKARQQVILDEEQRVETAKRQEMLEAQQRLEADKKEKQDKVESDERVRWKRQQIQDYFDSCEKRHEKIKLELDHLEKNFYNPYTAYHREEIMGSLNELVGSDFLRNRPRPAHARWRDKLERLRQDIFNDGTHIDLHMHWWRAFRRISGKMKNSPTAWLNEARNLRHMAVRNTLGAYGWEFYDDLYLFRQLRDDLRFNELACLIRIRGDQIRESLLTWSDSYEASSRARQLPIYQKQHQDLQLVKAAEEGVSGVLLFVGKKMTRGDRKKEMEPLKLGAAEKKFLHYKALLKKDQDSLLLWRDMFVEINWCSLQCQAAQQVTHFDQGATKTLARKLESQTLDREHDQDLDVLSPVMRFEPKRVEKAHRSVYFRYSDYLNESGAAPKVHYCRSVESTERVAALFHGSKVLGLDLEWKACATAADGISGNVSLIQLANEERIALFHVAQFAELHAGMDSKRVFSDDDPHVRFTRVLDGMSTLRKLLEDPKVTKVGVAIKADSTRLAKYLGIDAKGLLELSHLHNVVKYQQTEPSKMNKRLVSLAKQTEEHVGKPLYKGSVRMSAWEYRLDYEQTNYAASDVYASLQVFYALEKKRLAMDAVPLRPAHAELNIPLTSLTEREPIISRGDETIPTAVEPLHDSIQSTNLVSQPNTEPLDLRDFKSVINEDSYEDSDMLRAMFDSTRWAIEWLKTHEMSRPKTSQPVLLDLILYRMWRRWPIEKGDVKKALACWGVRRPYDNIYRVVRDNKLPCSQQAVRTLRRLRMCIVKPPVVRFEGDREETTSNEERKKLTRKARIIVVDLKRTHSELQATSDTALLTYVMWHNLRLTVPQIASYLVMKGNDVVDNVVHLVRKPLSSGRMLEKDPQAWRLLVSMTGNLELFAGVDKEVRSRGSSNAQWGNTISRINTGSQFDPVSHDETREQTELTSPPTESSQITTRNSSAIQHSPRKVSARSRAAKERNATSVDGRKKVEKGKRHDTAMESDLKTIETVVRKAKTGAEQSASVETELRSRIANLEEAMKAARLELKELAPKEAADQASQEESGNAWEDVQEEPGKLIEAGAEEEGKNDAVEAILTGHTVELAELKAKIGDGYEVIKEKVRKAIGAGTIGQARKAEGEAQQTTTTAADNGDHDATERSQDAGRAKDEPGEEAQGAKHRDGARDAVAREFNRYQNEGNKEKLQLHRRIMATLRKEMGTGDPSFWYAVKQVKAQHHRLEKYQRLTCHDIIRTIYGISNFKDAPDYQARKANVMSTSRKGAEQKIHTRKPSDPRPTAMAKLSVRRVSSSKSSR